MNAELIRIIEEKKGKEPMICISGDFNFPFVDWELEEEIESEIEIKRKGNWIVMMGKNNTMKC